MTMVQEEALLGPLPVLKISGREFKASLTFNSLCEIEDLTGKSFLDQSAWRGDIRMKDVNALVFCAVKRLDAEISLQDIKGLVKPQYLKHCIEVCLEALHGRADKLPPLELLPSEARRRLVAQSHKLALVHKAA